LPPHSAFLRPDHPDVQFTVSAPRIAAAVAALADLVESGNDVFLCEVAAALQVGEEAVAFGVYVGGGDVRDVAGRAAGADTLVDDRGPDPDPTVGGGGRACPANIERTD
jgi:hypothetical protein